MNDFYIQIFAELFSITVGIFSYRRKSVAASGLAALLLITGTLIIMNQIASLVIMFSMFASSSILTRYKKSQKAEFEKIVTRTGPRDAVQAFANLGTAFVLGILYYFTGSDWLIAGLAASVAAANADSWASETGGLSSKNPVSILTLKPVQKGLSGGVTLTGSIGGIAGAVFITTIAGLMFHSRIAGFQAFLSSVIIAGIAGCFIDSLIGALFQAAYADKDNNLYEGPEKHFVLVKGISWINNDMVNLLTTLIAGIAGSILYLSFL
jgi:uncharacterized protein (TIGR00297 family)